MPKVLFATSEAYPLVKTGGLGDVSSALPSALKALGFDIRLVLPGYRSTLTQAGRIERVRELSLPGKGERIRLFEGALGPTALKCYLVDAPSLFDRPRGPYAGPDGQDWPDNAERFAVFARAVVELAQDRAGSQWQPDLVHCNDWQTGLIPPLLERGSRYPASVFTIHNLAYQGLFDWHMFGHWFRLIPMSRLGLFFRGKRPNLLRREQNPDLNEGGFMSLTSTPLYCPEWSCQQIEAPKSYTVKVSGVPQLYYCRPDPCQSSESLQCLPAQVVCSLSQKNHYLRQKEKTAPATP